MLVTLASVMLAFVQRTFDAKDFLEALLVIVVRLITKLTVLFFFMTIQLKTSKKNMD